MSSVVTFRHVVYFSSPIASLAYLLLSSTIRSSKSLEKKSSKISSGDSGMASTVGPTGEESGWMSMRSSWDDHEDDRKIIIAAIHHWLFKVIKVIFEHDGLQDLLC